MKPAYDRFGRWGALLALVALTACGGGEPLPDDRHYTLGFPSEMPAATVRFDLPLIVAPIAADAARKDRAVAYRQDAAGAPIMHYHYHNWTSAPPALIRDYLLRSLRSAAIAEEVEGRPLRSGPRYVLDGRLVEFERVKRGGQWSAQVRLSITLSRQNRVQGTEILLREEYAGSQPAGGSDMQSTVRAFETVVAGITRDILSDLEGVAPES